MTIGNFDGVHHGHRQLLQMLHDEACRWQLPSVMVTFEPHPAEFFSPEKPVARLMRFSEKWRAVEKFHIDYFYQMTFNQALANLSAKDFVTHILVEQLQAKKIVIGDDFRFGEKRLGDVTLLKNMDLFEVIVLPQSMFHHARISSMTLRLPYHIW